MLTTFAVRVMRMTTGRGPQLNVTTPPFATAATTRADVQLAGVPLPTTAPAAGAATIVEAARTAGT